MNTRNKKLIVTDIIGSDAAVSTDNGDFVFHKIEEMLSAGNSVELDFLGIEIMTTAFLNAAIGQLYSEYSSLQLNHKLKLVNVADDDKILFTKVIARAKEYFKNKASFEESANHAMYGS